MPNSPGSTARIIAAIQAQDAVEGHDISHAACHSRDRRAANALRTSLLRARAAANAKLERGEADYIERYREQDDAGRLATWNGLQRRAREGVESVQHVTHASAQDCPGFVEAFRVS